MGPDQELRGSTAGQAGTGRGGGADTAAFRTLLRRSILALAACAVLVAFSYCFVDRPAAFFVHGRRPATDTGFCVGWSRRRWR